MPDGFSQIYRLYAFRPSGLKDYGSATLCCKILSLPFLGFFGLPLRPPPWRNPRRGRAQILPSGNLEALYGRPSFLPFSLASLRRRPMNNGWPWPHSLPPESHFQPLQHPFQAHEITNVRAPKGKGLRRFKPFVMSFFTKLRPQSSLA